MWLEQAVVVVAAAVASLVAVVVLPVVVAEQVAAALLVAEALAVVVVLPAAVIAEGHFEGCSAVVAVLEGSLHAVGKPLAVLEPAVDTGCLVFVGLDRVVVDQPDRLDGTAR